MLKVLSFNIYDLLHPSAILCFVTPYIAMEFKISSKQLLEPFFISTPVGEYVQARQNYGNYIVSIL